MERVMDQKPMKDRRDIGNVETPIERLQAARELSSCCVGVEASLLPKSRTEKDIGRLIGRIKSSWIRPS